MRKASFFLGVGMFLLFKLIAKIKEKLGWTCCPQCNQWVKLKVISTTKDKAVLFFKFGCPECDWVSNVMASPRTDDIYRQRVCHAAMRYGSVTGEVDEYGNLTIIDTKSGEIVDKWDSQNSEKVCD